MLKLFPRYQDWAWVGLYLICLWNVSAQTGAGAPKPEDSITVRIQVTDKASGNAINNADIEVRCGATESMCGIATTDSQGMAKLMDIHPGKAIVRVIAKGYDAIAPKFDLKTKEPLLKVQLEKETAAHNDHSPPPPSH